MRSCWAKKRRCGCGFPWVVFCFCLVWGGFSIKKHLKKACQKVRLTFSFVDLDLSFPESWCQAFTEGVKAMVEAWEKTKKHMKPVQELMSEATFSLQTHFFFSLFVSRFFFTKQPAALQPYVTKTRSVVCRFCPTFEVWCAEVHLDLRAFQSNGLPNGGDASDGAKQAAALGLHDESQHLLEAWKK